MRSTARLMFNEWTRDSRSDTPISSHQGCHELPFQRWFKFKEAFSPNLLVGEINRLKRFPSTCIDPCGGCGTTGVSAQFLGIRPTIIEINPFLADLVEAKLATYVPSKVRGAYLEVVRCTPTLSVEPKSMLAAGPATFLKQKGSERWVFPDDVIHRVLQYREAISQLQNPSHRRLFRVLLGSILVDVSNVLVNGKGRKYRRNWPDTQSTAKDVDRRFRDRCLKALSDIAQFRYRPESDYAIRRGSFRDHLAEADTHDLAFFSPPYPNSFDYTDIYNLELWVLGYLNSRDAESQLRHTNIHSHVQVKRDINPCPLRVPSLQSVMTALEARREHLWNARIPEMIDSYFFDMYELLEKLRHNVSTGGDIFAVIGDSSYTDVVIPVAEILEQIAEELGLSVVENRRLRNLRSSAQQGGAFVLGEDLLHLRV